MRVRARVSGVVQGVGFRPFVYGLATDLGLSGFVFNDARGVTVEVEGGEVETFLTRLREAPPLATIESLICEPIPETGEAGFAIRPSPRGGAPDAPISPDAATCDACLAELFDPSDRRYRYPFINCTDCGPRFTIVTGVPYDRPWTTMAGFVMCAACQAEYDDPRDRRFHAQPNACPACGPRVTGYDEAVSALRGGGIVAVKGIGGFHLACRADDEAAVARLRARKHREERPFALMARDAATLVELAPSPPAPRLAATRATAPSPASPRDVARPPHRHRPAPSPARRSPPRSLPAPASSA